MVASSCSFGGGSKEQKLNNFKINFNNGGINLIYNYLNYLSIFSQILKPISWDQLIIKNNWPKHIVKLTHY